MNSNQLPFSGGIAIFFAVIIGYFVIDPSALDGFRPGGDSSQIEQVHGIEDVQARLWQDPFAAAAMHKSSHKTQSAKIQLAGELVLPPFGNEHSTALEMTLSSSKLKDKKQLFEKKRHSLKELQDEICEEAGEQAGRKDKKCNDVEGITVLAVMVSAGPYAKPAETRKRMRYAVLSALGTSEYYPKDAEHIGYIDDLNTSENTKNDKGHLNLDAGEEQLPHVMPYEWYEKQVKQEGEEIKKGTKEKHVLLLWLDEDAFRTKPLTKLDVLFSSLGGGVSSIKLIGPYGSGTLKKMVKEAKYMKEDKNLKKVFSGLPTVDVYSATATAVDNQLIPKTLLKKEKTVESILRGSGFNSFQRTIATDGDLVDELKKELQLRMKPKEAKNMNYHVAIISEWDTVYGRAFRELFTRHYEKEKLLRFTYMRGIDGALASRDHGNQTRDKNNKTDKKDVQEAVVERPEGRSQKDYLRRLADQISRKDKALKSEGERGIRAIGVLGSDVYDKLLILRVLRERFPKAVFFTTDLDAALLHPDQFRWTRNLVVASAYDLNASDMSNINIPPFRDSYQTSVFRSARKALGESVQDSSAAIYEIGRNGAVSFSVDNEKPWIVLSRSITACLLFLWLVYIFKLRWSRLEENEIFIFMKKSNAFDWVIRKYGPFLLLFSIIIAGINFLNFGTMAHQGIVIIVGMMFFALYGLFFVQTGRIYRRNCYRIFSLKLFNRSRRRYRNRNIGFLEQSLRILCHIIGFLVYRFFRRFALGRSVHLAFWLIVLFVVVLIIDGREPFSIMSGVSIWPAEVIHLGAVWLAFFLLWHGWSNMQADSKDIEGKLGLVPSNSISLLNSENIAKIWGDYKWHGRLEKRISRIFIPVIIWGFICLLIFKLQSPNIPFRGAVSFYADRGISFLAIFAFIILFGFVVDAVMHCRKLIQQLIKYDTYWPFMEDKKKGVSPKAHKLICAIKREWKETHLIAMRSDDISKTVYYPIYVILLLLMAQSDYFDNWDMPYTLMLIATVNVGIILWAAIALRRSAVEARDKSLDNIRHIESKALGLDGKVRRQVLRKVRFYKAEIENIREGAFLPISEQPWLRALTLMGGGGGSLLLLQAMAG